MDHTKQHPSDVSPPEYGLRHVRIHRPVQQPVIYQMVPDNERWPMSRRGFLQSSALSMGALGVAGCGGGGSDGNGGSTGDGNGNDEPDFICIDPDRPPLDNTEYQAFTESEIRAHAARVNLLEFSPDGSLLVSAGGSSGTAGNGNRDHTEVKLWSVPDGNLLNNISNDLPASRVQFSDDGSQLHVQAAGTVSTWNLDPVDLVGTISGVFGNTWLVRNNAVKTFYVSNNIGANQFQFGIAVWNLTSGTQLLNTLRPELGRQIFNLLLSLDNRFLAVAYNDGGVDLHEASGSNLYLRSLDGHPEPATMAFSDDGSKIATSGGLTYGGNETSPDVGDTSIKISDTASGVLLQTLIGHGNKVNTLAFNGDGSLLVSGSGSNVTTAGLPTFTTPGTSTQPSSFDENSVRVWDTATGTELLSITDLASRVRAVAISPDGQYVSAGSQDNTIKIWRVSDGELLAGLFDPNALEPEKTVNYLSTELTDSTPVQRSMPVEAQLPAMAGCTCNCVAGNYVPKPPAGGGGPCNLVCVCVPVTFPGVFV